MDFQTTEVDFVTNSGSDKYGTWELVTNKDLSGRKLNKPFRTPGGPKKFAVYVKNDTGNVVLVRFGDPNMEIKRDDPNRRANFRARHQCDSDPGPKWKARYWACRTWTRTPVSKVVNVDFTTNNCGIGSNGFELGNTCASGKKLGSDGSSISGKKANDLLGDHISEEGEEVSDQSIVDWLSSQSKTKEYALVSKWYGAKSPKDLLHKIQHGWRGWGYAETEAPLQGQTQLVLQLAAEEEFNHANTSLAHFDSIVPEKMKSSREFYDQGKSIFKGILRASYNQTQNELSRLGISSVLLYRGAKIHTEQPVESWSIDSGVAKQFSPNIIEKDVPIENILSVSGVVGGFGDSSEFEAIVLGGENKTLRVDFTTNFDPSQPRDDFGKWTSGGSELNWSLVKEEELPKLKEEVNKVFPEGDQRGIALEALKPTQWDQIKTLRDSEGNLKGVVRFWIDSDTAEAEGVPEDQGPFIRIRDLASAEKGGGWGSKLLDEVKEYARSKKSGIYLTSKAGAQKFWEKKGFNAAVGGVYWISKNKTQEVTTNFDPNQPRDKTGRWTESSSIDNWEESIRWQYEVDSSLSDSVRSYQGMFAENLNKELRLGLPLSEKSKQIDDALSSLQKMGKFNTKGVVFRGISINPKLDVGDTYEPRQWQSSSVDFEIAKRFALTGGSTGLKDVEPIVLRYSNTGGLLVGGPEQEVILPKNARFKVRSIESVQVRRNNWSNEKVSVLVIDLILDKQPTTNSVRTFEVVNAFCPTGPGGGIDNSCSPNRKGSGIQDTHKTDLLTYKKLLDKMPLSSTLQSLLGEMKESILKAVKNGTVSKTEFLKYGLEIEMTSSQLNELFEETSQVFPPGVDDLEFVQSLGGSTGAIKVRDPKTGNLFVLKKGANPGHLLNEDKVNELYRAADIQVPLSQMYPTKDGPVRLTKWIEGGRSLGELSGMEYTNAVRKVQKGFALDATLANWDVVGMNKDNIMVDPNGNIYRIDNAGSLTFRAQGGNKGELWNSSNSELESMLNNPKNPSATSVFGGMTKEQLIDSYELAKDNKDAILSAAKSSGLHPEIVSTLESRFDVLSTKLEALKVPSSSVPLPPISPTPTSTVKVTKKELLSSVSKAGVWGLAAKLDYLNPDGVKNGIVYVPKGTKPEDDAKILDIMSKKMPAGTSIVPIGVTKKKDGTFQVSSKDQEKLLTTPKLSSYTVESTVDKPITPILPLGGKLTTGASWSEDALVSAPKQNVNYSSLSVPQKSAIGKFTGPYSTDIQKVFTDPNKVHSEDSKRWAKNITAALDKIPKFKGTVYRGLYDSAFTQGMIKTVNEAGVGGFWKEIAPHSTSRSYEGFPKNRAVSPNGVLMVIKTATGRPVEDISSHPGEREVMGREGTTYRINGIHNDAHIGMNKVKMVVELEELE